MGVRVGRRKFKTQREIKRVANRKAGAVVRVPNSVLVQDVKLLNGLTKMKLELVTLEGAIRRDVRAARRAGATWQKIGRAVGVSTQAASRRWGPYPEKSPRVPRARRAPVEASPE